MHFFFLADRINKTDEPRSGRKQNTFSSVVITERYLDRMTDFLKWTDDLKVGNDAIDNEHKAMLDMANTFLQELSKGKSEKVLHGILTHLIDVSREHFKAEEKVLKKEVSADLFLHHRDEHKRLLEELRMLDNGFAAAKLGVDDILPFLQEWLFKHIKEIDLGAGNGP